MVILEKIIGRKGAVDLEGRYETGKIDPDMVARELCQVPAKNIRAFRVFRG